MYEITNYTWQQVQELWIPIDHMNEWLHKAAGVYGTDCSFEQKGRWLIATAPNGSRWAWDDTTGEWNGEDDWELDCDEDEE